MYVAQISSFRGPSSIATVHYEAMIKAAFPRTTNHKHRGNDTVNLPSKKKNQITVLPRIQGYYISEEMKTRGAISLCFAKSAGVRKQKIPSTLPF